MNRQKREEAIRAGLMPDKKKHEPRPDQPGNRDEIRGGHSAEPEAQPKPQHQPIPQPPSESRR